MADTPATSSPSNPNPDYFTAAGNNIDQAKAQTLANVAQYGSQAKQQFAQAQQANQDAMTNAVKQAMAFSIARGAPGSDQSALQGQVQAPFNERGADLAASLASRSASLGEAGTANGNYFDQLKAALPALQAGTQQKVAALQAAVAAKQQAANGPGAIIRGLGGSAAAGDAINAAAAGIAGPYGSGATPADTSWTQVSGPNRRLAAFNASPGDEVSLPDAQEQVGGQLGLAPGQGAALGTAASTAAQRAAQSLAAGGTPSGNAIRNSANYPTALAHAQSLLQGNKDEVAAVNQLVKEGMDPGSAYVIVSDAAAKMISGNNLP